MYRLDAKNHKYDTGIFSLTTFSSNGRPRRIWLFLNLTESQKAGKRWDKYTNGTHVIQRVLWNSSQQKYNWNV